MLSYAIGIDFGTQSGRALLVDMADGCEIATAVHPYTSGVIDRTLPESGKPLPPDWALQDPDDDITVLQQAIPIAQQSNPRLSPQINAGKHRYS